MSNNKHSIIDSYECGVYDFILVVANEHASIEELRELYTFEENKELPDDIVVGTATTTTCYRKSDNAAVILVKYNHPSIHTYKQKHADFINTCSHEATHVALDIYEWIGQNVCFCTPEPICYLVGWATECIYTTLTKK